MGHICFYISFTLEFSQNSHLHTHTFTPGELLLPTTTTRTTFVNNYFNTKLPAHGGHHVCTVGTGTWTTELLHRYSSAERNATIKGGATSESPLASVVALLATWHEGNQWCWPHHDGWWQASFQPFSCWRITLHLSNQHTCLLSLSLGSFWAEAR